MPTDASSWARSSADPSHSLPELSLPEPFELLYTEAMVGRRGLALALAGGGTLALAAACVDLFHSTNFETKCDLDANAEGCPAFEASHPTDAKKATSTDFCEWNSSTARGHAEHACAWLGACSAPFDTNAFGPCMIDAILAYDCNTNPNRRVRGALHDLWDALWQAQSCDAVTAALVPQTPHCATLGYGCGATDDTTAILFECLKVNGTAAPESCLAQGRACDKGSCVPPEAFAPCVASECVGSLLHDCEDGVDMGYDCQYFGSGACAVKENAAACLPADAGAKCAVTTKAMCDGDGAAIGCTTGRVEAVDCETLTGPTTCHSGTPIPSWNLAGACEREGGCVPGCDGDILKGCGHGAEFTTKCSEQKLGSCTTVPVVPTIENPTGYACVPPDP